MTIYPTKKPCPCLGCKDRTVEPNCHGASGHCPNGYQEWLKDREETKKELKRQEKAESDITSHMIDHLGKLAKRNRRSWQR
jgi:hypothetical protein